ncbi:hypothetical protein [Kitasatospora sp. NPDC088779]|uniref:hypothetical protein n=1 Tax=unclassified Kitasatospora TaxID=2633591 RepID=UPI00344451AF
MTDPIAELSATAGAMFYDTATPAHAEITNVLLTLEAPAATEKTQIPTLEDVEVVLTRDQVDLYLEERSYRSESDRQSERGLIAAVNSAKGKRKVKVRLTATQACDLMDYFEAIAQSLDYMANDDESEARNQALAGEPAKLLDEVGAPPPGEFNARAKASTAAKNAPRSKAPVDDAGKVAAFPAAWDVMNRYDLVNSRGWTDHLIATRLGQPDRLDTVRSGTATRPVGSWNRERILQAERELREEQSVTAENAKDLIGQRVRIEPTGRTGVLRHVRLMADGYGDHDMASVDLDAPLSHGVMAEWGCLEQGVTVLADQTPVVKDARAQMEQKLPQLRQEREETQKATCNM